MPHRRTPIFMPVARPPCWPPIKPPPANGPPSRFIGSIFRPLLRLRLWGAFRSTWRAAHAAVAIALDCARRHTCPTGTGKGPLDESKLPKIFFVNWFRRDEDGRFLWPGFGENSRVLKWIFERCEGTAEAVETPIGNLPNIDGLCHISELDEARVGKVEDVVHEGDEILVKCIGVDSGSGKIRLSRKAALKERAAV